MKINIKKYNPDIDSPLPEYKTEGSAGMDISSSSKETVTIPPGKTALIPTNIIIELPQGYEGQVRPRSGLALKFGITVLNSPGTVDSDYRGEIGVVLINHGDNDFEVKFGDRIAQLIIAKYERGEICEVTELSSSTRGEGGYGSTGV
jgi:dUTP pyrophosphatase